MKKLRTSTQNKRLLGVCGGIAEYFQCDVTLVRALMVLTCFTGAGPLVYILSSILMQP